MTPNRHKIVIFTGADNISS